MFAADGFFKGKQREQRSADGFLIESNYRIQREQNKKEKSFKKKYFRSLIMRDE